MLLAILLVGALAWWLHSRGELLPNLLRFVGTGAAGLIAWRMLIGGRPLLAVIAAALAVIWWRLQAPPSPQARALKLLGLKPGADAAAIQAAWRQKMASAHPDAGGNTAEAQALTAARDLLLAQLARD